MNAVALAISSCWWNRLEGWRHVQVTAQRTRQDYAKILPWLVDEVYPHVEYIRRHRPLPGGAAESRCRERTKRWARSAESRCLKNYRGGRVPPAPRVPRRR